MALDKIGNSAGVPSKALEQFNRSQATQKDRDTAEAQASRPSEPGTAAASGDRAEISEDAQKVADLKRILEESRMAYDEAPDIRRSKVEEVKNRLASGYYESVSVKETLAARLGAVVRRIDEILE